MKRTFLTRLCSCIVIFASISPVLCRGLWFDAEESAELERFFSRRKNEYTF